MYKIIQLDTRTLLVDEKIIFSTKFELLAKIVLFFVSKYHRKRKGLYIEQDSAYLIDYSVHFAYSKNMV